MFRKVNRLLALSLAVAALHIAPAPAFAQSMEASIVAIVNDEVISRSDLESRLRLALIASGVPDTPDNRQRLRSNVLRALIEEKLKVQDALSQGVTVGDEQIQQGLAEIAGQNKMTPDALVAQLRQRGISRAALVEQVRAQIAWNGVVNGTIARDAVVTEEEVDQMLDRIAASAGEPEIRLAEILIPVNRPTEDPQARALAERLVREIRGGASFPAVARQFSSAAGASNGGDLGYVTMSQLDPEVQQAVKTVNKGQISPPVRTLSGWQIFAVIDRRVVMGGQGSNDKLTLTQLVVPLGEQGDLDSLTKQREAADTLRGEVAEKVEGLETGQCEAMQAMGAGVKSDISGDLGSVQLADLPAHIRAQVTDLDTGTPSPLVRTPQGWMILMVCDREKGKLDLPEREQVRDVLARQKMDMLSRRRLRDLQAEAFIETR